MGIADLIIMIVESRAEVIDHNTVTLGLGMLELWTNNECLFQKM